MTRTLRLLAALILNFSFFTFRSASADALASSGVNEFFSLPAWLPNGVPSRETPGSDPEDGSGWYADEYTNGVRHVSDGDWRIYVDGKDFGRETYLRPGHKVDVMNNISYGIILERLKPREFSSGRFAPYELPGPPPGATVFEWDQHVEGTAIVSWDPYRVEPFADDFHVRLETDVDVPAKLPTGRRVPRASRLTPALQSSLYATFGALYERLYFASQGQSNVWDTATYGPRSRRHFRFDLPRTPAPRYDIGYDPVPYDPDRTKIFDYQPTNRTVTTRRLVEWDNIDKFANFLVDHLAGNGFRLGVLRPGWCPEYDYDPVQDTIFPGNLWWSTQDDTILAGDRIIPNFSWTEHPEREDWSVCSQAMCCLTNDAVWSVDSTAQNKPGYRLMIDLGFGAEDWDRIARKCVPDTVRHSVRDLIETNYPNADGWAVTNATRRLFSNRLCCANQLLGLLDRTYHQPLVEYPSSFTNDTYRHSISYTGRCDVAIRWNPIAGEAEATPGEIDWFESPSITNGVTSGTDQSYYDVDPSLRHRVTRTETDSSCEVDAEGIPVRASDETVYEVLDILRRTDDGAGRSGGFCDLTFRAGTSGDYPLSLDVTYSEHSASYPYAEYYSTNLTVRLPFPSNVTARAHYLAERSYTHMRTAGHATLGPTQPGFEAGDRAITPSHYGAVVGVHERSGMAYVDLYGLSYDRDLSTLLYMSGASAAPYMSRSGLLAGVASLTDVVRAKFAADYGVAPSDWQAVIPIDIGEAERSRDSARVTSIGFGLTDNNWRDYTYTAVSLSVVLDGDHNPVWTINGAMSYAVLDPITGEMGYMDGYGTLDILNPVCLTSHNPPRWQERDSFALDGLIGVMTRTDWKWHTLNRTDDQHKD